MINFNGVIIESSQVNLTINNRAFKYGDGLFETIKLENNSVCFLEDHYFRLMASMRMLRMEIPMNFTLDFFETELLKVAKANNLENARLRITVYRQDGGLYTPNTNQINFIIEANKLNVFVKMNYEIDLYKDYFISSGLLSTIKTTNKLTNVLAGIYASENNLDNCILLNENKLVVEAINGNIFLVKGNVIKTPSINTGCVKGIMRKKIIELISKNNEFVIEEAEISPFELQKVDELFITNVIVGIQPVTVFRKTTFKTLVSTQLLQNLTKLI
jgi:branched-chain amino acid aminotransferase